VPLEPLDESACFSRREGLVKRRWFVGVEIVFHEHNPFGFGEVYVGQFLEDVGEIHGGVAIRDLDMPPTFNGANIMNRFAVPLRSYS
jgi:hypothetical protein